jgi:hypothetical protein
MHIKDISWRAELVVWDEGKDVEVAVDAEGKQHVHDLFANKLEELKRSRAPA